jgi:dTDP-4-dehydrorhamnose reductase
MFLITGAKGQLGRCLVDILKPQEAYFCDIEEMDIADVNSVRKYAESKQFSAIIDCAGYTNVEKAEDEPDLARKINVEGAGNLAKLAAQRNVPFIHISTDYVFGGLFAKNIFKEDDETSPLGVYAQTKLEGENEIRTYSPNYVIIRTAWLYSQYGDNFLKTILRMAGEKPEIKVVDDQIGTPTYAPDLASVIAAIANSINGKAIRQIYHFSNEGVCSWYDFAYEIIRQAGLPCKVLPIKTGEFPAKAKRPFFSVLDKS